MSTKLKSSLPSEISERMHFLWSLPSQLLLIMTTMSHNQESTSMRRTAQRVLRKKMTLKKSKNTIMFISASKSREILRIGKSMIGIMKKILMIMKKNT